jgi:glycosyltransferase involved in cell wall biosynthesis
LINLKPMAVSKILYLCYFGLREPLVQTQVIPYLRELARRGEIAPTLLTFEPNCRKAWTKEQLEERRARLSAEGIDWLSLPYHKRPSLLATAYDILAGAWKAARLVRRDGIQVLHARAHVPMAMALLARKLSPCRMVFDIRGLMAEEYADAGVWRENSLPYRLIKWLERAGIRRADQVVVLTERMRAWLIGRGLAEANKIEVIPCCVDFQKFEQEAHAQEKSDRFEVVYAGSVTGLYMLEEMGRFFLALRAREPRAFLHILTQSSAEDAGRVLKRAGLTETGFRVGAAPAAEIPAILCRASLGISFRKPTFSQIAASPTKIPEYLAAGLPVVSNAGIGDTDALLESEAVGVVVRDLNPEAYAAAAERILVLAREAGTGERCRRVARERFDLARIGGARYHKVYQRISEQMVPVEQVVHVRR